MSRPLYYDRDGEPITLERWIALVEDADYRRIARTDINGIVVSTVWLGIDHQFGDGPPLIFETMIFGGPHDEETWRRYDTEANARAGHDDAVAAVHN